MKELIKFLMMFVGLITYDKKELDEAGVEL